MQTGLLIVLSGPSGAGKDTIIQHLMTELPELQYSVSATTRAPRRNEVEGVNYFFVSTDRFHEMIGSGEFLEWAKIYDYYYGTPRENVEAKLRSGQDIILKLDVQGGNQVKKTAPGGIFIFIVPPSLEELHRRIEARGTETPEMVEKRFLWAVDEIRQAENYDYIVINEQIPQAVAQVKAIIAAEKCRASRNFAAVQAKLLLGG